MTQKRGAAGSTFFYTISGLPKNRERRKQMNCRGIRGAISVDANTTEAIIAATRELLEQIVAANDLRPDDISGVIFTATPDLDAAYPARAAREMGWAHVPLSCMQEMSVVNGLSRCIRVIIFWNTDRPVEEIRHIYLGAAQVLRPDLAEDKEYD
jgi:chorismate mutase